MATAVATAVAATLMAACAGGGEGERGVQVQAPPHVPPGVDVRVERVVDGDTIVVSGGRAVRLIGVDTPETRDPRRPVGCFGKEAGRFTASLLPPGTPVRLVGDVEQRDAFGRTLAYVYRLPDGEFVNAELLRQGYAMVLTVPPNVAHSAEFVSLAGEARAAGRGLWAACRSPGGNP